MPDNCEPERKGWLQQQITVSNLIYVATILITLGAFWSSTQTSNAEQDRRLTAAEAAIAKSASDTSAILQAIAELKTDVRYLSRSIETEKAK